MPMNPILIVDIFDVWGIDFIGPFPMSFGEHLLKIWGAQAIISDRVYGKACHLPVEVEYKAWWAIKRLNMDLIRAEAKRCLDLNEMEELRNDSYINSKAPYLSKEAQVRWIGPFIIHQVHLNGVVELLNSNGTNIFKVNGHRLKPFIEPFKQEKEESTSLSHRKPNQRREELQRNSKKEARNQEELKNKEKAWYQEELSQSTLRSASSACTSHAAPPVVFSDTTMAITRGTKSSSPSTRLRILRDTPIQGSTSEPPRPRVVPPLVEDAPISPLPRHYNTRRSLTMARVSSSRGQKSVPVPQRRKPKPKESQIPSGMTPEVFIKRPMVTQPLIERNLDCKARSFHSELCFDIAIFRLQPDLKDSFRLLQRYHMEHLLTPKDFFYPRVALTSITLRVEERSFAGRHCLGYLRDTSLALTISSWPLFCTLKRRSIEEATLSGCYSTSLPQTIMPDIGALGIPTLARPEHPEELVDIPADMRAPAYATPIMASSEPIPEIPPSAPQATPHTPPVIPSTSEPSPSAEPRIAIPIIEYRGLCHTFQALATSQSILTQQMTTLRAH
ncbi:hypothetical protein CK203_053429 [Vitis vinifera]|uniref:Uncharacterized protein n=1 Tax=Vitis vinifera TaxID=29760 RepID=A0A438GYZ5_VITVI|nr:hypothetical protein CK203_053429 [Vitis vinifera]